MIVLFFIDIDECMLDTDECSANSSCVDTEGSYNCTCDVGYVLQDDLRTCLRKCDVLLAVLYSVTCSRLSNVVFLTTLHSFQCALHTSLALQPVLLGRGVRTAPSSATAATPAPCATPSPAAPPALTASCVSIHAPRPTRTRTWHCVSQV